MLENINNSLGNISSLKTPDKSLEPKIKAERKIFSIEIDNKKFNFTEFKSAEPSDVLVIHFPGLAVNSEKYTEYMHSSMDKSFCSLALGGYGETYSRDSLLKALQQIIQLTGKHNVIFHGNSFGSSIVYDLISEQDNNDFLIKNNITGAILETPVLDKEHLQGRAKKIPDRVITLGVLMAQKARKIIEVNPKEGLIDLSNFERKNLLTEALREKTSKRKITLPVYIIFSNNENLSDNNKIMETLKNQAKQLNFDTVKSASSKGHNIDSGEYESMFKKEKKMIENFLINKNNIG